MLFSPVGCNITQSWIELTLSLSSCSPCPLEDWNADLLSNWSSPAQPGSSGTPEKRFEDLGRMSQEWCPSRAAWWWQPGWPAGGSYEPCRPQGPAHLNPFWGLFLVSCWWLSKKLSNLAKPALSSFLVSSVTSVVTPSAITGAVNVALEVVFWKNILGWGFFLVFFYFIVFIFILFSFCSQSRRQDAHISIANLWTISTDTCRQEKWNRFPWQPSHCWAVCIPAKRTTSGVFVFFTFFNSVFNSAELWKKVLL